MKKLYIILIVGVISLLQYCTSSKKTAAKRVPVTYIADVQPTIAANCSPCHIPPKGSKKALDSYIAVNDNIGEIIRRINLAPDQKGFMPFKHAKLSDSLINVFVQWQADGLLEK